MNSYWKRSTSQIIESISRKLTFAY